MCNTFPSIKSIQIEINEPIKLNLILFNTRVEARARTHAYAIEKNVFVSMKICSALKELIEK